MVDAYITEKSDMGLPAEDFESFILDKVSSLSGQSPSAEDSVAWVEANLE
jgi:hypothetical protein